ncbi:MAG: galactosyldiacylglycerol synthase [Agathobaculum sp.]|uniref:MGDG synthase family glycosyltransferase n=1 Tax=Agathobaculum sp. TaxID=2048138 RepID=UPI0025B8E27C|nr:glycosyltransferase [Agathobaculum sp.]MCI7126260.1 galactosyldiacylglycerol synthase [Agathobaculum sp.]MDY3711491.1 glycosyltransferase [Agathobaculum sp.]
MRVLILSVTAGFGHHATGKAIGDMLLSKGAEVHTLDVYAYISNLVKETIDKGYLFSSQHMQTLYRLVYQLAENGGAGYFSAGPGIIQIINALGASKFAKVLVGYAPDVIICTHVFAAQMIDELKKRKKLSDIKTIGIVTDYTLHPYWEDVPRVQYIVTASELLTYRCVQRGIPEERILPFGIPVHPKFNQPLSREDAARQLGLDPARPTILLMGGSMGHADHVKTLEKLTAIGLPFQLLVVCGNNKKMFLRVEQFTSRYEGVCTILPFGFVHNVDVMMSASDCIVSKPGGLTVSEALAKNLPMLLADPIPGHEERNVDFLVNNGMAALITKHFPIDEAVYELFRNPVRLQCVRQTIKAIAHPDATERLADFVLQWR